MLRRALWVFLLGMCACEGKPVELPYPTVEIETAVSPVIEAGAPITVEMRALNPDGSLSIRTDLTAAWSYLTDESTVVEQSNPAPGIFRITLTHTLPGWHYLSGNVKIFNKDGAYKHGAETKQLLYLVWGGPTTALSVLNESAVDLVVGERRPLLVVPTTPHSPLPSQVLPYPASSPVTWRSGTPSVATVTAAGEVTAVSVGTTAMTVQSGSETLSIPVTVRDGVLGPPPEGFSQVLLGNPGNLTLLGDRRANSMRGVIDSRGWPAFVLTLYKPFPGRLSGAALVRWTGSGWGVERVNQPWLSVGDARLAIDDHDRLFVGMLLADERQMMVVAERHIDGPAGEWRHAELPVELRIPKGLGLVARWYGRGQRQLSLRARPGGGVWLGIDALAEFDNATLEQNSGTGLLLDDCLQGRALFSLTDAGLAPLRETDSFFPRPQGGCADGALSGSIGIRPGPDGGAELDFGLDVPFVPSARWSQQTSPDGGRLPGLDAFPLQWDPQQEIAEMDDRLIYLMKAGGNAYSAPGFLGAEDTTVSWVAGTSFETADAWARTGRGRTVLHVFREVSSAGQLSVGIGIAHLPPLPDFLGDDSRGSRIYPTIGDPPPPFERPLVLPSGSRLILGWPRPALGDPGGIDVSTNRGTFVRAKEFTPTFSAQWPLATSGTEVYAVGPGSGVMAVSRSTDEGRTWQGLVAFPFLARSGQLEVFTNSAALATAEGRLFFSPGLISRQALTENTSAPAGYTVDRSQPLGLYRLGGDRVGVAALVRASMLFAVWWREFDSTGAVVAQWQAACSVGQGVSTGAVLPDGSVLLVRPRSATAAAIVRAASGGAPVTTLAIPQRDWVRLVATRLADGRAVFGGEYLEGQRGIAAWFSTADGVTFSEPTRLRPLGGNGQTVYGVVAEGAGVAFVVGDNGSIVGRRLPVEIVEPDRRWAGLAPLVPLWHSVVVP